jgi:hypothetical protein
MHPDLLLRRLDAIGDHVSTRVGALALIGLGSSGAETARLDEHSDLDFFVIVEDGVQASYLAQISWLEAVAPVAYSFANSPYGRKLLYADGVFCEYAVFTPAELATARYAAGRIVWSRPGTDFPLESVPTPPPHEQTPEFHLNEALTNLFVGLHRELRGERLTASRFIQVYAVDRVLTLLRLAGSAGRFPDRFEPSRRAEQAVTAETLPLAELVPGYRGNAEAARVMLSWLEARYAVDPAIAGAIRDLLDRCDRPDSGNAADPVAPVGRDSGNLPDQ